MIEGSCQEKMEHIGEEKPRCNSCENRDQVGWELLKPEDQYRFNKGEEKKEEKRKENHLARLVGETFLFDVCGKRSIYRMACVETFQIRWLNALV